MRLSRQVVGRSVTKINMGMRAGLYLNRVTLQHSSCHTLCIRAISRPPTVFDPAHSSSKRSLNCFKKGMSSYAMAYSV